VEIPPLRERGEDVLLLARHFAAQLGKELRGREALLSDESLALLRAHSWPGNVRELENVIERACILADDATLEPRDLGLTSRSMNEPDALQGFDLSGTLSEAAERAARMVERRKIAGALKAHDGNKTRAAEALSVSYKTLLTKIKEYEL
jgi:DNA-binding NtrC family response regulator